MFLFQASMAARGIQNPGKTLTAQEFSKKADQLYVRTKVSYDMLEDQMRGISKLQNFLNTSMSEKLGTLVPLKERKLSEKATALIASEANYYAKFNGFEKKYNALKDALRSNDSGKIESALKGISRDYFELLVSQADFAQRLNEYDIKGIGYAKSVLELTLDMAMTAGIITGAGGMVSLTRRGLAIAMEEFIAKGARESAKRAYEGAMFFTALGVGTEYYSFNKLSKAMARVDKDASGALGELSSMLHETAKRAGDDGKELEGLALSVDGARAELLRGLKANPSFRLEPGRIAGYFGESFVQMFIMDVGFGFFKAGGQASMPKAFEGTTRTDIEMLTQRKMRKTYEIVGKEYTKKKGDELIEIDMKKEAWDNLSPAEQQKLVGERISDRYWWMRDSYSKESPVEKITFTTENGRTIELYNYMRKLTSSEVESLKKAISFAGSINEEGGIGTVEYIVLSSSVHPNSVTKIGYENGYGSLVGNERGPDGILLFAPAFESGNFNGASIPSTFHGLEVPKAEAAALHEFGHHVWENNYELQTEWRSLSGWKGLYPTTHSETANFVSDYAKSNPAEDFCDSFMAWRFGLNELSPEKAEFFNRHFGKLEAAPEKVTSVTVDGPGVKMPQIPAIKVKISGKGLGVSIAPRPPEKKVEPEGETPAVKKKPVSEPVSAEPKKAPQKQQLAPGMKAPEKFATRIELANAFTDKPVAELVKKEGIFGVPSARLAEFVRQMQGYAERYPDISTAAEKADASIHGFMESFQIWHSKEVSENVADFMDFLDRTKLPHELGCRYQELSAALSSNVGATYDLSVPAKRLLGTAPVFDIPCTDGRHFIVKIDNVSNEAFAHGIATLLGIDNGYRIFPQGDMGIMELVPGTTLFNFKMSGGSMLLPYEEISPLGKGMARENFLESFSTIMAQQMAYKMDDSHAGNFMVQPDGSLVRIDYMDFGKEATETLKKMDDLLGGTVTAKVANEASMKMMHDAFVVEWSRLQGEFVKNQPEIERAYMEYPGQGRSAEGRHLYAILYSNMTHITPEQAWEMFSGTKVGK